MDKLTFPNLLSLSRLLMAPIMMVLILKSAWVLAALILWLAIATDLLDGYWARRQQQTTPLGGFLDHGCDALLVTTMLAAEAMSGLITWWLPPLVILAFSQYTLDSKVLAGQPLRASSLGRYNGILYFVLAGFPIMQHALSLYLLSPTAIRVFSYLLVTTTVLSMLDRLMTLVRVRTR